MINDFLQIPVRLGLITGKNSLPRCSLYDSVAGMVHLILTTHFGENKCEEAFGNELWEHDFETIENMQAFKEKLAESLRMTISVYEKRLTDIRITIGFEQVISTMLNRRVRQRIEFNIEGTIAKTNEKFTFRELFFTGPLSYY
jgi:phage baseplate assembly protein W